MCSRSCLPTSALSSESIVFACGSEAMIQGARQALVQSGLPEDGTCQTPSFVPQRTGRNEGMIMKAVILAGGFGTRLSEETSPARNR